MTNGSPQFLVARESRWRRWRETLVALGSPGEAPSTALQTSPLWFQNSGPSPAAAVQRGHLFSGLLHAGAFLAILHFPLSFLFEQPRVTSPITIVYDLKTLDLSRSLPALRTSGPGGRPGRGTHPDRPPVRGSTAHNPKLTLASVPRQPDNNRQTIIQPSSPPDLKIPVELRLPNIVIPRMVGAPKRPTEFRLDNRARMRSKTTATVPAPEVNARPTDLAVAPSPVVNPLPRLAVAPAPSVSSLEGEKAVRAAGAASGSGLPAAGSAEGLLIIGVDPAPFTGTIELPPGNRYGAFSISPFGGQPGSPGGVPGGDPNGGTGGPGTGGDGSTGVGPGGGGGGGTGQAGSGFGVVGITGPGAGSGSAGIEAGVLVGTIPENVIFPVKRNLPRLRGPALTVTTGPIGGGGLRVYGVLRGGKIYTIYLPMPGKNWIFQYCQVSQSPGRNTVKRRGMVAQLEHSLVPPVVEEQYDFLRPPVPEDKANEVIILRGVVTEDGKVRDLRVYRGVDPIADQLALLAFNRWRFQPALKAKKPIAIEFLVGVPAQVDDQQLELERASGGGSR